MGTRIELHNELVGLGVVDPDEVHFQPPESVKLHYPCIIYKRTGEFVRRADDTRYLKKNRYNIIIISRDPDNEIADCLLEHFKHCRFDRRYVAANLYHDSLELFY